MTPEFNLQWGAPTVQRLDDGLRTTRRATPTEAFWAAWRRNRDGLTAKGYGVTKRGDVWVVTHWSKPVAAPPANAKADVPLDPPRPLRNVAGLLPYQWSPTSQLLRSLHQFNGVLDASDTGVGKTYMAMAVARELGVVPLVVCPKTVIPSWQRVAAHMGHPVRCVNYEKVRMGSTPWCKRRSVRLSDKRAVEAFVWGNDVKLLLFDEVHRCAGTDTLNSALLVGAALQSVPTIAMSATAATNPMHMKALGFLLGLHGLRDFWEWAAAHGCFRNQWDGWEFGGDDEDILQIRNEIFPARGIRVTVASLGDQFPPTQISTELIPVESPAEIDRCHAAVHEALAKVRASSEQDEQDANGAEHLVARLRARQTAELLKLPAIAELTKDALAEGRSVFVALNFNDSVTALRGLLGTLRCSLIVGGQSADERDRSHSDFQANRTRVCIANGAAGGVGISLHDTHGTHPRTALLLPGEDPRVLKQLLGRVWRKGGTTSIQRILYAAGTVEESQAERMETKLRNLDLFNDGLDGLKLTAGDMIP